MSVLAINKRAHFDYAILESYEAGIALFGHEVKSIKTKHVSLKESFVTIHGRELYLTNAHIPPYIHAGIINNYNPTRPRKLLLKKSEIKHLIGKARTQGLTLVPIKLYTKKRPASTRGDRLSMRGGLIKLEFGLGKGKKEYDKRDKIKKREDSIEARRALKNF
ncbi:MAG: SsrA-binding protein [Candidatus Moranbacteria bacterium CG23_combo_of_CG06-09_8_20_14_all_35_22]|nr:MAG: SsrA-binding protein [Candidatus Moranbacteria bacterium CG23_combo_of_CG06-09_8_20_14_all_35_22]